MDPEGVSLRAMHKLKTKKYICSESNMAHDRLGQAETTWFCDTWMH